MDSKKAVRLLLNQLSISILTHFADNLSFEQAAICIYHFTSIETENKTIYPWLSENYNLKSDLNNLITNFISIPNELSTQVIEKSKAIAKLYFHYYTRNPKNDILIETLIPELKKVTSHVYMNKNIKLKCILLCNDILSVFREFGTRLNLFDCQIDDVFPFLMDSLFAKYNGIFLFLSLLVIIF